MKRTKTQKGITLVALIITIVVLLILAMVGIGAIQDSNIIAHAQNAAGSFNQAKNNEVDALTKYEEEINKYVPKTGNVEYYIMGTLENPGTAAIQRLDFKDYTLITYYVVDGVYTQQVPKPISFSKGEKIADKLEINVIGVTEPVDMKDGYKFLAEGYPEGYIKDKKLYAALDHYVCFELVEDDNTIAAIEAGIASIK